MSNFVRWYNHKNAVYLPFNIKDGYVFSDNLSEQLDSATIVINKIGKNKFEPFDIMTICESANFEKNTMLIDNVIETQVSFNPIRYDYTLNLMSYTKMLERIIVPNMSYTKPKGAARITLLTFLQNMLEDYSPKYLNQNNQFVQLYTIMPSDVLLTEMPDIYIGKGTLRSAIDTVLSVIKHICRLNENNQITTMNLDLKGNQIDLTKINYNNENQSSSDYATTLDNQYNNVVPNIDENLKNYTLVSEYIGFRSSTGIMTTDNATLMTSFPIYDLKNVVCCCGLSEITAPGTAPGKFRWSEVNILDNDYRGIAEIENYKTLEWTQKQYYGYYTRNSKNITITGTYNILGLIPAEYLNGIINNALINNPNNANIRHDQGGIWYAQSLDYSKVFFKVSYYTQVDTIRAKSGKYLPESTENNEIVDNPSETYVDIKQQGRLFNLKCNRLGNRVKIIMGRYRLTDTLPVLGDTLGDFVLMNRELTYFDNFILFRGTLTENFVNINYFTGINARKRSWQIVSASEAFDKQLLDKYYCEFSFQTKTGADITDKWTSSWQSLAKYFMTPLYDSANFAKPVKHLTVEGFYDERNSDGTYTENQYYHYELELNSYITGNSLLFHSEFYDNYSAGIQNVGETTGGYKMGYAPYTDKYGTNLNHNWFHYTLICDFSIGGGNFTLPQDGQINNFDTQVEQLKTASSNLPRLTWTDAYKNSLKTSDILFDLTNTNYLVNHKDSREKISLNIQFEFCSDTNNIVVGPRFLELQKIINALDYVDNFQIFVSNDVKYVPGDSKGKGVAITTGRQWTITSISNSSAKISYNGQNHEEDYKYIGICDMSGNLLLGINKNVDEDIPDIYLNILRTRDRNRYLDSSLKNWIL